MSQVVLPCAACGAPVTLTVTNPLIANHTCFSMATVEHPEQVACACGAILTVAIRNIQGVQLYTLPLQPKQESRIITPGGITN